MKHVLCRGTNVDACKRSLIRGHFGSQNEWPTSHSPQRFLISGGMSGDRPTWTYPKRGREKELGLKPIGGGPPSARGSGVPPSWAKGTSPGEPGRSPSKTRSRPKESTASTYGGEVKPLKLRKTEGVHAVAAWAARREILNLLESGVDPKALGSPRSLSPRSKSPRSKDSIDSRWEDPPSNNGSRRFKSSSSTPLSSVQRQRVLRASEVWSSEGKLCPLQSCLRKKKRLEGDLER